MPESILSPVSVCPCTKCGTSDRFESGGCKSCSKASRALRKVSHPKEVKPAKTEKFCKQCNCTKPMDAFKTNRLPAGGFTGRCAECLSQEKAEYSAVHKTHIAARIKNFRENNLAFVRAREAAYSKKHRAARIARLRDYYIQNRTYLLEQRKIYAALPSTKNRTNMWVRNKKINSPLHRLKSSLSSRIRACLKKYGYEKKSKTCEILGCEWDYFKSHIERQFVPGMCWQKIGVHIHIDHILPLAMAKNEEEMLALSHFTNLRPMWAKDNLSKGAKRTHLI